MMQSRRTALATLGGTVAATAVLFGPLRAQTAPNATLRIALIPISDVAPMFAAQAQGYFADEHLTMNVQNIAGGGAAMIPALVAGDLDVAYSNAPSTALAIERGIDLRILLEGTVTEGPPPSPAALVKRAGDPIATGKDLEGKRIAVNALGNVQWLVARAWVRSTGGDPDKVSFVEVPIPTMTEALDTNRVSAAFLIDPFTTLALEQTNKYAALAWPFNTVYESAPIAFWVCTNQVVQTKAPLVQAFVRAYRRGVAWVNQNRGKEPLVQLLASYTQLKPEVLRKLTIQPAPSTVDVAHFKPMLDLMLKDKLLTKNVDLAAHVYAVS